MAKAVIGTQIRRNERVVIDITAEVRSGTLKLGQVPICPLSNSPNLVSSCHDAGVENQFGLQLRSERSKNPDLAPSLRAGQMHFFKSPDRREFGVGPARYAVPFTFKFHYVLKGTA